jgi:Winged helix DNA-binding domain
LEATRSMVCLHATDPATVYLSAWARVEGIRVADVERALYVERSLVKQLAMRRTLFVFPRESLGLARAATGRRLLENERRKLIRDVEAAGMHADGERWLAAAEKEVVAALADGREATSSELRAEIPLLEGATAYGEGKSWGGRSSVAPRVLTVLSAAGQIVRASNNGAWTTSRPRWTSMQSWLGEGIAACSEPDGVAALVERWLRAFGPGTATDIRWWLGSTVAAVRRALAELGAVEVDLDGRTGYLLPDDLDAIEPVEPWAALLPPLDPTTMGWFERDWYLGPYREQLFDTSGNAGPTVWWQGRLVGGWHQSGSGEIVLQLLEDIGADGRSAVEDVAARLTDWLGADTRVLPRFPSPLWSAAARRAQR